MGAAPLAAADRSRLPVLRKAAQQAVQYSARLRRRLAKARGDAHIPGLARANFKRASTYKRIEKRQGTEAAMSYILALTAG
jgi:hypothetical protein